MLNLDLYKTWNSIDGERKRFKTYTQVSAFFLLLGVLLPIPNPWIDIPSLPVPKKYKQTDV